MDPNDVLAVRSGLPARMLKYSDLSADIRNAKLEWKEEKPHEAVLTKENIEVTGKVRVLSLYGRTRKTRSQVCSGGKAIEELVCDLAA